MHNQGLALSTSHKVNILLLKSIFLLLVLPHLSFATITSRNHAALRIRQAAPAHKRESNCVSYSPFGASQACCLFLLILLLLLWCGTGLVALRCVYTQLAWVDLEPAHNH